MSDSVQQIAPSLTTLPGAEAGSGKAGASLVESGGGVKVESVQKKRSFFSLLAAKDAAKKAPVYSLFQYVVVRATDARALTSRAGPSRQVSVREAWW